jgi:hypothetical protein
MLPSRVRLLAAPVRAARPWADRVAFWHDPAATYGYDMSHAAPVALRQVYAGRLSYRWDRRLHHHHHPSLMLPPHRHQSIPLPHLQPLPPRDRSSPFSHSHFILPTPFSLSRRSPGSLPISRSCPPLCPPSPLLPSFRSPSPSFPFPFIPILQLHSDPHVAQLCAAPVIGPVPPEDLVAPGQVRSRRPARAATCSRQAPA